MHDPDNGLQGDCARASIASLLNVEKVTDVPHFAEDRPDAVTFWRRIEDYLHEKELHIIEMRIHGMLSLEQCLNSICQSTTVASYFMLSGESPRHKGSNHMVVCQGGRIVHDPHPDDTGLAGPAWPSNDWIVKWLVPLHQTTFGA